MITEKQFNQQKFLTKGIIEATEEKLSYMAPNGGADVPHPDPLLREKIRDLVFNERDKYEAENHSKISIDNFIADQCDIPYDTFKKYIGNNMKYKISRTFIAKIAVGLKLEILEADKLFRMHSGELNLTNCFDYITYYALNTKDEIDVFKEELKKYAGIDLDKNHS